MGDGDHGAGGELALDEARHLLVRHDVHGRGGLVQYQQFRVPTDHINEKLFLLMSVGTGGSLCPDTGAVSPPY